MAISYIIKQSESFGRYILAGRDLTAGEEISVEEPFSIGPKAYSYLICLGCYLPLGEALLCEKCFWPVCSPECSENAWHKNYECEVFSKAGVKFQEEGDHAAQLECITPLRTLIESEKHKDRWQREVVNLESHIEKRREKEEWKAEKVNVVNFLQRKCKLDERFSEATIEKVCGILEVNCFEVVINQLSAIRGLYPRTSLLNHNCVANTTHSIVPSENFRLQLRATVDIKNGCELFASYTSCLLPTIIRRAKLKENKYFDCSCSRCSDPNELGSHIGTLKCTKCDNGIITSTNPLDPVALWKCSHCENGITGKGVQRVYNAIQEEVDKVELMEMSSEKLETTEKLLRGYKSVLHPKNGYNVTLWHSLSQMYGHTEGYTLDMLPDLLLERKSQFCKDLLDTLDIVEPGYTRIRGLTLYEYHVGLLLYSRSRYQYGEISVELFKEAVKEVIQILEECSTILSLEPPNSSEAAIATAAQHSLEQLKESLANLK